MANSSDDEVHSSQFVDAESDLDGNFDSRDEETARSGVQHAQPSSSATYNADWLSDLIGEAYAVTYSAYCVPGIAPRLTAHACRPLVEPGAAQGVQEAGLGYTSETVAGNLPRLDALNQDDKVLLLCSQCLHSGTDSSSISI